MHLITLKFGKLHHQTKLALSLGLVAILMLVAPTGRTAFAQSATTGAIGGVITDTGGALLPGTSVTVTSAETAIKRIVKSNATGEYRVSDLEPGTCVLTGKPSKQRVVFGKAY